MRRVPVFAFKGALCPSVEVYNEEKEKYITMYTVIVQAPVNV